MNKAAELVSLMETLERKLGLFRELTSELVEARPAFVKMELDEIYSHISRQKDLCEQLRQTEESSDAAWKAVRPPADDVPHDRELPVWLNSLDVESADQFRRLLTDIALAEGELRHQNRINITLVDGSRRTLNVLENALAAFSPTYTLPAPLKSVIGDRGPGDKILS
jgi:prepilin-type processing-associated H-X9-DG protein